MSDINFAALGAEAVSMINANQGESTSVSTPVTTTPQVTNTPPVTSTPIADPNTVPTPVATGTEQLGQPAEKLFEVDLGNGRVEKLTEAQLKEAYFNGLRQADYTKKAQEVARQRQEVETLVSQLTPYQQQVQYAQQLLNNPQLMLQEAQRKLQESGGGVQTPALDPNQPLTVGQYMQMQQAMATHMEQQRVGLQQHAQQIVEDRMQVANFAESINQTLNKIYTDHPVLKAAPEMEDMLRYRVAQLEPKTLEEAQSAFQTVASEFANSINASFNARQQELTAQRAKLASTSTEPPTTGGVPALTPPSYMKDGKKDIDWNTLTQAAKNMVP